MTALPTAPPADASATSAARSPRLPPRGSAEPDSWKLALYVFVFLLPGGSFVVLGGRGSKTGKIGSNAEAPPGRSPADTHAPKLLSASPRLCCARRVAATRARNAAVTVASQRVTQRPPSNRYPNVCLTPAFRGRSVTIPDRRASSRESSRHPTGLPKQMPFSPIQSSPRPVSPPWRSPQRSRRSWPAAPSAPTTSGPPRPFPRRIRKRAEGWKVAQPADRNDRGNWWTIYNDPQLNDLENS